MKLDVSWQGVEPDKNLRKTALKAARAAAKSEARMSVSASLLFTDDETIRQLNSRYRGVDSATDVLSFPSGECGFAGDIAISVPQARLQAEQYGHTIGREIAFLTVHAMLHLFGYDHIDESEETEMRQRQRDILRIAGYEIDDA
jgi:probable rRNA maturation factor